MDKDNNLLNPGAQGNLQPVQLALLHTRKSAQPEGFMEQMFGQYLAAYSEDINRWAVQRLNIQAGDHILEIGFGAGVAIDEMVQHTHAEHIVGIDCSTAMVEITTKRNREAIQDGKVCLQQADVAKLPAFDTAFDRILSVNSIMYWASPVETLKRLRTVLKPGGSICIVYERDAERVETGYWDEQIEAFARHLWHAGFAEVGGTIQPVKSPKWPYMNAAIAIQGLNPILCSKR